MTDAEIAFSRARQIDILCDKFENDWKAGLRPQVEAFVETATETERDAARSALKAIERELQERSIADTSVTGSSVVSHSAQVDATALHEPARAFPVEIGRFTIRDLLGSGAFGQVYRAFDPQLGREVAVKTPIASTPSSAHETARFLKEARAAATMNHPNICQIHEVGEHVGRPYIVMPLIRGESLAQTLRQRPEVLNARQIALIVRKLALALAAAHAKGIVHRDLKPANIMFDRERKDLLVMDFGLARGPQSGAAGATQSGIVMGTPAYMSPEQARGDSKEVRPAGDIYSLGVILYELMTGTRPYNGTATEVIGQILHVEPEAPSRRRAGVDPVLEAACLRAMAKDPAARFASMKEFAVAVDGALKRPAVSTPAAAIETARAKETRRESADGQGSANMSELFAVLSADRKTQQAATAAAVDAAVRRSRTPPWIFIALCLLLAGGLSALAGIVFFTRSDNVRVTIKLNDVDLADETLSFFLDDEPISAKQLANPIELKPGEHTLVVKRGKEVVKRMLLTVTGHPNPGISIADDSEVGFVPLFNGNDLTGWKVHLNDGKQPPTPWQVDAKRNVIVARALGQPGGGHSWLETEQSFEDYELSLQWRFPPGNIGGPNGSGVMVHVNGLNSIGFDPKGIEIDLRKTRDKHKLMGTACFQTYDTAIESEHGPTPTKGNGNLDTIREPTANLDGKWNTLHVRCVQGRIQVTLNDILVNEAATVVASGKICLRNQNTDVEFRRVLIKPLGDLKPSQIEAGFTSIFDGETLDGWQGATDRYAVSDGAIQSLATKVGFLYTKKEYGDFHLKFSFKLTPGANSGVGIRAPLSANPAYAGLEIQVLDDEADAFKNSRADQYHGSIYGNVPAKRGHLKPVGMWNEQEVIAQGSQIKVILNGETIVDADLAKVNDRKLDGQDHPGLQRKKGHIVLCNQRHNVWFKNLRIKEIVLPKVDHDRVAAEYILSVGGKVSINFQSQKIGSVAALPDGSFQLTAISLNGNKQATNAGLAVVKECKQLRNLDLGGSQITDAGLAHFKDHVNINHLGLPYMKMTDEGLANFKNCKELNSLVVHDTKVTDVGLAHFQDCKNLETLWVSGLPVTDEVVIPFANCKYMKWIDLRATKVTSEGYRKLRAALPNCIIGVNPGIK